MLVNNQMLTSFQQRSQSVAGSMPEFPSVDFSIENNPEFGDLSLDGMDQTPTNNNGQSFADLLNQAIDGVSKQDQHAVQFGLDFALGRNNVDVHQVMIEQAKAESQIHLMSAVTNKVASSYQTLMNMQI
ncbi:MAG TPA: flagellar hook-basal body complex protein FliE [Stenomitos sp.]